MKLDNLIVTYDIGGEPCRVGKLTIGAACEIERYLATLETPLEKIERSKILTQIDGEKASGIIDSALQDLAFWPPDAVGALCSAKFLTRGEFALAFISAIVRQYNPHFTDADIERVASKATVDDVFKLQAIALGANTDPKDESGLGVAQATTGQPSGSSGVESSPG